jgi:mannose-6-phosphate isomerase-like protein (cupin superfamily)
VDQALTFTSGMGKATINGKDQDVKAGDLMVVPAGTQHQFVNTGPTPLVSNHASEHSFASLN